MTEPTEAELAPDMKCGTAYLADLLGMTQRNILNLIERGMPTLARGKQGESSVFDARVAVQWWAGDRALGRGEKKSLTPLETVLIGVFINGRNRWETFAEAQDFARLLAERMDCTQTEYERALGNLLTQRLIFW